MNAHSRHPAWLCLLAAGAISPSLAGCAETEPSPAAAQIANPIDPQSSAEIASEAPRDWPTYRGDLALSGVAAGQLPDDPAVLWSFESEGAIVSSPVIADGRVYVGSDDGNIYAIDFATGEKIWAYPTEYIIEAPPFIHDGMVYVGAHDFIFYALDAVTGELVWKLEMYEKIAGGATVVKGPDGVRDIIVVGSHDAFLYGLDAKTGEKVWEFETNDRINATPAVVDNTLVFGGCDTILYRIDGATGESVQQIELGGECFIAASAAIVDGIAFFGHNANEFVAIDLKSEEAKWVYPNARFGFFCPPAVTDEYVVFGGRDKNLHCVNRATGEGAWTFAARRKIDAAPVICGDRVVFGSGDGRLYIVNLSDGTELWSYDIGDSIFSSPAIVDGVIVVGSNDGRLYAFGVTNDTSEDS